MNSALRTGQEKPQRRTFARRLAKVLLLILLPLMCIGSTALLLLLDQTSAAGLVYLSAVNTGNTWTAELLGDHYSDDKGWHQRLFQQDIQRDEGWLKGAEISDVTTTREQTLSGQWVTMLRFKWHAADSVEPPRDVALRVKTDNWLILTYVRTVKVVGP